jgi:putative NIF3 family GTP cyclohydrolase 1 type 2
MPMTPSLSRRAFGLGAAALTSAAGAGIAVGQPARPTAQTVIDRIWKRYDAEGVPRRATTVDVFKAGDPATLVTGIATVFMATWDVLKKAKAQGLNLVVTHEPTFWSHQENLALYDNVDHALYDRKKQWIAENGMVVWRAHDHWHARKPEPMLTSFVNRIGWGAYEVVPGRQYLMPETTLGALARQVQERLATRNIRVVGDPAMKVTRVARGGHIGAQSLAVAPLCDVVIVSEGREFDAFEFVRDCNQMGIPKGLIMHAHQQGEETGMQVAEVWLASIAPEVPVRYIPTGESFWIPGRRAELET